MKKSDQKKYTHLPAIEGGVVTSVREEAGQVFYRYRVPARVLKKQKRAAEKLNAKTDADDIGQGEGCEGGKCKINRGDR